MSQQARLAQAYLRYLDHSDQALQANTLCQLLAKGVKRAVDDFPSSGDMKYNAIRAVRTVTNATEDDPYRIATTLPLRQTRSLEAWGRYCFTASSSRLRTRRKKVTQTSILDALEDGEALNGNEGNESNQSYPEPESDEEESEDYEAEEKCDDGDGQDEDLV